MRKKKLLSSVVIFILLLSIGFTYSCDENNNMLGPSNDIGDLIGDDPSPSKPFDLDIGVEMMRLSLQAYQMLIDFDNNEEFTLPAPYNLVIELLTPESFFGIELSEEIPIAYIATNDNNIYLVFRGTKTIDEWIKDADFPLVPYPLGNTNAMSEKGFTEIYETLGVVEELNMLAMSGNFVNLFVTGHSLGAALAVVAIPDIIENTQFKNPIMYSFAGPRVGDQNFKNLYDGFDIESWRVFNTNDEVPKLPPSVLSYIHINNGEPITFGKPVSGPFDFKDIEFNHDGCNYFNTLCGMTNNPTTCMAMADGADGCNADMQ